MGNIAEQALWELGIRQLEETDDVVAGPDGVSNTQAKQLANRTTWLKSQVLGTELISGTFTVKNKWVVSGFELPADPSESERSIYFQDASDGNGFPNNYALWGGRLIRVYPQTIAIPQNPQGNDDLTLFIYVEPYNNTYRLNIGSSVPFGAMGLYLITIPGGDTAGNMYDSLVDILDIRESSGQSSWAARYPIALIDLPEGAVDDTDYGVHLELTYSSNGFAFEQMVAYDRALNGFKVQLFGFADDAIVRWVLQKIVRPSGV